MNEIDLQEFPCSIPLVKAKSILAELKEDDAVTFIGPRCCKSSVRAAIYEAVGFLNEYFYAGLEAKRMEKACAYSKKHDYCQKARCRFFPLKNA